MLQTLGGVIECGIALAALILVPLGIARAWWPEVKKHLITPFLMSREQAPHTPIEPVDEGSCHLSPEASHPIAITSTTVNDEVTVNAGDGAGVTNPDDIIPTEAREIIRHYAKAEAVADLIQAGLVTNQAKAIEAVYHCSRTSSSRPETPYQKARRQIDQLVNPRPTYYDDLRAQVENEVRTA